MNYSKMIISLRFNGPKIGPKILLMDIHTELDRHSDIVGREPHVRENIHPPVLHANICSPNIPHSCASDHGPCRGLDYHRHPCWPSNLQTIRLQLGPDYQDRLVRKSSSIIRPDRSV